MSKCFETGEHRLGLIILENCTRFVWLLDILLQIYYGLVLKEHLRRTQEKLERDCLEHHCERSLKFCKWSSTQVNLFLLTGESGIVNVESCGMHWYLS